MSDPDAIQRHRDIKNRKTLVTFAVCTALVLGFASLVGFWVGMSVAQEIVR